MVVRPPVESSVVVAFSSGGGSGSGSGSGGTGSSSAGASSSGVFALLFVIALLFFLFSSTAGAAGRRFRGRLDAGTLGRREVVATHPDYTRLAGVGIRVEDAEPELAVPGTAE